MTLSEGFCFHKTWKGHNGEWNINTPSEKRAYLDFLSQEHQKISPKKNPLRAICVMSNHVHEIYTLDVLEIFCKFMRSHHSRYGMYFNKKHQRHGKVAQDRPHTSLMENHHYEMMATFYIHANPLRAGICKDASSYQWSTHALYAFGKRASWMKDFWICFPKWYMALGKTWAQRQKVYRKLFAQYLKKFGEEKIKFLTFGFGTSIWTHNRKYLCRTKKPTFSDTNKNAPPSKFNSL